MADPRAVAAVQALRAAGHSNTAIARALGRDVGMVSQIARGARSAGYGASLVPGLQQLVAQGLGAPVVVPRRTTRAGAPVAVRRSTRAGGGARRLRSGQVPARPPAPAGAGDPPWKAMLNALNAAPEDQPVTWAVHGFRQDTGEPAKLMLPSAQALKRGQTVDAGQWLEVLGDTMGSGPFWVALVDAAELLGHQDGADMTSGTLRAAVGLEVWFASQ